MVDQVISNTFQEIYRDDFTDSAGFHRILFNNGRPIQARELTQLQTIIQREITRFGNNVFKDGATVTAGGIRARDMRGVKLNEGTNPLPADLTTILNTTFTGQTSGIQANLFHVEPASGDDPATIYVNYLSANNSAENRFLPGENLTNGSITLTVQTTDTTNNPARIRGLFLSNGPGDFYAVGRFVFAPAQTVLVSKYNVNITDDIGFKVIESIVTANDDITLYDNSGALPNTSSPGADRYKIELQLTLRSYVDSDETFVYVARMQRGEIVDIQKAQDEKNFNVIADMIARRTSEESGDYIVKPYKLTFKDNTLDNTKLNVTISPGLSYVQGYRVENLLPVSIAVPKPRSSSVVNNEVTPVTFGNYVLVNGTNGKGLPSLNDFAQVNLRTAVNHGGTTIGTARIRAVTEDNVSGQYRIHLFQINMNSGTNFRSVRSIGTSTSDYLNIALELGQCVLYSPRSNNLLFNLPRARPKTLTDISVATQRKFTTSVTAGTASLSLSATGETFANTNDWILSVDDGAIYTSATITGGGTTSVSITGLGGASTVEVIGYVNKAASTVRTKTLVEDQTDTIAPGDWDSDGNGTIYANLTKPDIYSFTSITRDSVSGTSVASRFIQDNGQRDNFYGLGRLVLKPGQSVPSYDVAVKYDYFSHSVSGDFFAVSSYSGQVDYENIPSHRLTNGKNIQLRDVIDFRPVVNSSGTFASGARINELPQPDDTVQADVEYYHFTKDKIIVTKDGEFRYLPGKLSLNPSYPETPAGALDIYRIAINAYCLSPQDLVAKQIEHKHYNMKAIGRLEKRLDFLEEQTTLSLLELDTANLAVLDSDGLTRTKSGFFVDNFVNHFFSDIQDPDYAASIDPANKAMRPTHITQGIDLMYDSSRDYQFQTVKKGDNIYLSYTDRLYVNQLVTSTTETLNPIWHMRFPGQIDLSPASDNWVSTEYLPNAVVNATALDVSQANLWNDWDWNWNGTPIEELATGDVTNQLVIASSGGSSTRVESETQTFGFNNTGSITTNTTFEDSWSSTTTGVNRVVGETTITEIVGDRLIQTAAIPFMRSRKVYFRGTGFRPDVEVFPFFGGIDVSDWCREETFVRTSDNPETVGNVQNNALGHPEGSSTLVTDANGTIEGSFFIPSTANFRFPTGTQEFVLIDVTNPDNTEFSTTWGSAVFTAAGVLQTRQQDQLNTRILEIASFENTTVSNSTIVTNSNTTIVNPDDPPPEIVEVIREVEVERIVEVVQEVEVEVEVIREVPVEVVVVEQVEVIVEVPVEVAPTQTWQEISCFVAGTQVTMADGNKKNIEDVLIGEKLLGQDGVINTVIEYDHPPLGGRDLIGINGNGPFMTPEHPLYTKNGWRSYSAETFAHQFPDMGFLDVKDLQVGDEILMEDGSWMLVESLEVFSGEPEQTVYNFCLDGNNTYFANGLLAHNRAGNDPLAQSFSVHTANGIFVTKIDLYFSAVDNSLPMWIELRPMADGYPSYNILPGSVIYKYPGEIQTSEDGSVATTFEFEEPIFLDAGKEYALVAASNTPNYRIFISRVGDFELGTTDRKITQQPFLGSLFKSQNARTWTATQWEDMKFRVHTAQFSSNTGYAELTNVAVPQILLNEDPFSVDSGDATIKVFQPGHGFTVGDTVTISGAGAFAGIRASSLNGARTITARDGTGYTFEADSASTSAEIGGGAEVLATQNIVMDVANINLQTLLPRDTNISYSIKTTTAQSLAGTETAYQKSATFRPVTLGQNIYFDNPQMIANAANETTYLSGDKSFSLYATLTSKDDNVSPIIDMQRATVIAVNNRIDNQVETPTAGYNVPINYVSETNPQGGSHLSKHISKVITLAQDAVGLKIFLSANKPADASWDMYYRVSTSDNNIKDLAWTLVTPEGNLISDGNPQTFREYNYLVGGNTGDMDAFNQMQIKIVMKSSNSSKVPVFRDIRAIALST